jgi:hypothetical protein
MKKALAGPAKRTAKKKPERRAMIAAARRRAMVARVRLETFTRGADRRLNALLVQATRAGALTRALDRRVNRLLLRAWPPIVRVVRRIRTLAGRLGRRLRPVGVFLLRRLAWVERRLLRLAAWAGRVWARVRAVLTLQRAICLGILVSAGFLLAAQFPDYRAVEIGQPGYAGLPAATPPTVGTETAGAAHSYLLILPALLAGLLAIAVLRNERRRGLGRIVFALGLLSLAVVLLVDLPSGTDVGAEATRFSGARAVLYDPFYVELAAAIGLMVGGLLLSNVHRVSTRHGYRPRKPSLARTQGGRRRARTSGA